MHVFKRNAGPSGGCGQVKFIHRCRFFEFGFDVRVCIGVQRHSVDVADERSRCSSTRTKDLVPYRPNTMLVIDAANDINFALRHASRTRTWQEPPWMPSTSATYRRPFWMHSII
ncbi:hypothetical protein DP44_5293 [Burkholderia pseudomallei]|nr:hypothetical protein DP44_5293 [Burkholderia pseudomallei]